MVNNIKIESLTYTHSHKLFVSTLLKDDKEWTSAPD